MPQQYYTVLEVADYYRVSRATIWAWARAGRIGKPHKLSPQVTRWTADALEIKPQGPQCK